MAHFIGYVKGQKGEASRLGTKASGLSISSNGWRFGVDVFMRYNEEKGIDEAVIELTTGSEHTSDKRMIGVFNREDLNE